ncbi:MAG: methyltransferase domain-containing protein [Candidatus Korobacteraceae bacterium]|jgi:SAM-dependent methyltransferase
MRRTVIPELLDDDLGTVAEIAETLSDLRHINRWFGGMRTTTALLRRVGRECGSRKLSILEVGAGAGDVPLAAQSMLAAYGIGLQVTLLDRRWSHLPRGGAASVAGDALRLPFRDDTFDVVSCSLLAHHFEPETLVKFASESLRVCRHAVLINDLIRSRLHLLLVYLGLPLFRSRITWHDAPASVRRAYTCDEMRALLANAGARKVQVSRHYLFRMGVLLWK